MVISVYRDVTSSTRVVIANLIVSDHSDVFQEIELERNSSYSYVHCLFSLEEHLNFVKKNGEIKENWLFLLA